MGRESGTSFPEATRNPSLYTSANGAESPREGLKPVTSRNSTGLPCSIIFFVLRGFFSQKGGKMSFPLSREAATFALRSALRPLLPCLRP